MPKSDYEIFIKCPFYKGLDTKSISCEGVMTGCTTKLLFPSAKSKELHSSLFCEERYSRCEIYKMLEKKYED